MTRRSVLASTLGLATLASGCNFRGSRSTATTATTPASDGDSTATTPATEFDPEPLRVATTGWLRDPIGRIAGAWNANGDPAWSESDAGTGFADRFAARHGFERTGERYAPPFEVVVGESSDDDIVAALDDGTVDVGGTGIRIDASGGRRDTPEGLVSHTLFSAGQGLVVSPAVNRTGVETIRLETLRDVYAGRVTNWRAVGGPDREIYVVAQAAGSPPSPFARSFLFSAGTDGIDERRGRSANRTSVIVQRDDAIGRIRFDHFDRLANRSDSSDVPLLEVIVDGDPVGPADPEYPGVFPLPLLTNGEPDPRERAFLDALSTVGEPGRALGTSDPFLNVVPAPEGGETTDSAHSNSDSISFS